MASSMSLKWCQKNLDKFSQPVFDTFAKEHPELVCETAECVDHCGLCTDVPFALRNAAVVAARDPRGLYVKLTRGMSFATHPALPGTYAYTHGDSSGPAKAEQE